MAEYKDVEPLKKQIADFKRAVNSVKPMNSDYLTGYISALSVVEGEIAEQPTADVVPVRHGHIIWKRRHRSGFRHVKCLHRFCNFVIEDNAPCKHIAKIDERYTIDEPYCSECGKLLGDFLNYCGNCGAKMDEEEK